MVEFDKWYYTNRKCDNRFNRDTRNTYYKVKQAWDNRQIEIQSLKKKLAEGREIVQEIIDVMSCRKGRSSFTSVKHMHEWLKENPNAQIFH